MEYLLTGKDSRPISSDGFCLPDDGVLRVIQMRGNTVLTRDRIDLETVIRLVLPPPKEQPALQVEIWGSASVDGDIAGDVSVGHSLACGNIAGDASCGNTVSCGNIAGDVSCGGSLSCGKVAGDVHAGYNVTAEKIIGDVEANGIVQIREKP